MPAIDGAFRPDLPGPGMSNADLADRLEAVMANIEFMVSGDEYATVLEAVTRIRERGDDDS